MIKLSTRRKEKVMVDAVYLDYKDLHFLKSNSCIGVNRIYFNTIANRALQNQITDEHFWNIIRKYEKYERYSYQLKYHRNTSRYHIMSLRDIYYLIHITKIKPYSTTTFIKTNITEEELLEKHNKLNEEKSLTLKKKINK